MTLIFLIYNLIRTNKSMPAFLNLDNPEGNNTGIIISLIDIVFFYILKIYQIV